MSEPRDPAQVPAASSSSQAEVVETGLIAVEPKNQRLASEPIQVVEGQQRISMPLVFENLQVLTQFPTGALFLGGDELVQRFRYFQREVKADPQRLPGLVATDQETTGDLLRHLALGLFARGQTRVARGLHRGVYVSLGVNGSIVGALDRLTDNPLARPVPQPAEARLKAMGQEATQVIEEGRLEKQNARYLASQTVGNVIDDWASYA